MRVGIRAPKPFFIVELHILGLTQLRVATPYNFCNGAAVILPLHLANVSGPSAGLGLIAAQ